jgi:hypothetical protein
MLPKVAIAGRIAAGMALFDVVFAVAIFPTDFYPVTGPVSVPEFP